ncbi:MAG: SagB/ThcOx family dehydrogenase [Candidatus Omnitrophica bacterium]|nr:SagB/ThcOx family dehydrogenase [Candidatus Omnitrophota bacterium]
MRKFFLVFIFFIGFNLYAQEKMKIKLSPPILKTETLQELLEKRYSCRNFKKDKIDLSLIATILWAAGGKKCDTLTSPTRTIPSAGATYPLELYLVVGKNTVIGLKEGIYHYLIDEHALEIIIPEDRREKLASACLGQTFIKDAPVSLVIIAEFQRTAIRYGKRAERYVYMEAGHAGQNTYLAVIGLGLGTVEVGAFFDEEVKKVLNLKPEYTPLLVLPIGYPAD